MKKPDGGYIKLDRKILDWRWSATPNTFTVFVHLLMMANYKDGDFERHRIKRGSLATSYESLGKSCGLTYSQARTAVEHLKLTGEIAVSQNPRYIEISIVNYDEYQGDRRQNDRQIAGKSQADRRQIATRERKEIKEKKGRSADAQNALSGENGSGLSERDENDYPFKSGWRKKPDWMSAEVWERDKDMTVEMIPSAYRPQYDDVREYLHDRETGRLRE